jgi:hypothetical protein
MSWCCGLKVFVRAKSALIVGLWLGDVGHPAWVTTLSRFGASSSIFEGWESRGGGDRYRSRPTHRGVGKLISEEAGEVQSQRHAPGKPLSPSKSPTREKGGRGRDGLALASESPTTCSKRFRWTKSSPLPAWTPDMAAQRSFGLVMICWSLVAWALDWLLGVTVHGSSRHDDR